MKKIFFLISITILSISCSKSSNEEFAANNIPPELVGNWKLVGYYDDLEDPVTNSNYHIVNNGEILNFKINGTFDDVGGIINPDGNYEVSADLVIKRIYFSNSLNPNSIFNDKITLLTDNILEFGANQVSITNIYRYEKINTTPAVPGKK